MGKHNHTHNHCLHTNVAYCNHCNVCYCRDCGKEWGRNNWYWSSYQYPYSTTFNTDVDENISTVSVCNHS